MNNVAFTMPDQPDEPTQQTLTALQEQIKTEAARSGDDERLDDAKRLVKRALKRAVRAGQGIVQIWPEVEPLTHSIHGWDRERCSKYMRYLRNYLRSTGESIPDAPGALVEARAGQQGKRPRAGTISYWVVQHHKKIPAEQLFEEAQKQRVGLSSTHGIHTARSMYKHLFRADGTPLLKPAPPPHNVIGPTGRPRKASPIKPRTEAQYERMRHRYYTQRDAAAGAAAPPLATARAQAPVAAAASPPQSAAIRKLKGLIIQLGIEASEAALAEVKHVVSQYTGE